MKKILSSVKKQKTKKILLFSTMFFFQEERRPVKLNRKIFDMLRYVMRIYLER